jgi:hypothetical protein
MFMRTMAVVDEFILQSLARVLELAYRNLAASPILLRHAIRIALFFGYFGISGTALHEVSAPGNAVLVAFACPSAAAHLLHLIRFRKLATEEWTFRRYKAATIIQQRVKSFVQARLFNLALSSIVITWAAYAFRDAGVSVFYFAVNLTFVARLLHMYVEACDLPRPTDGGTVSRERPLAQTFS